ncbi:hypothetical protein MHU86_9198 [Fragilaria crotonensis]|nr:hypothetical protein MHU86_9198 [Fragilaria crotonensis]
MKPSRSTPATQPGAIAVSAGNDSHNHAALPDVVEPDAMILPRSSRGVDTDTKPHAAAATTNSSSPEPIQVTEPDNDSIPTGGAASATAGAAAAAMTNLEAPTSTNSLTSTSISSQRERHQNNLKGKEKPKVAATTPGAVAVSATKPEPTASDYVLNDNSSHSDLASPSSWHSDKNAKHRKGRRTPTALVPGAVAVSNHDSTTTTSTASPRLAKKLSDKEEKRQNAASKPGAVRVDGPVGEVLASKEGFAKRAPLRSTSSSSSTTTSAAIYASDSSMKPASTKSPSQKPGATAVSGADTSESILSAKERFAARRARLGQTDAPTSGDPAIMTVDSKGVEEDAGTTLMAEVSSVSTTNDRDLSMRPSTTSEHTTTTSSSRDAYHTHVPADIPHVSYEKSGDFDLEKSKAFTTTQYAEVTAVSAIDAPKDETLPIGCRRRRWIIIGVIVLAVIVGIVAAVVSTNSSKSSNSSSSPSNSSSPPVSVPTAAPTISSQEADRRKKLIQDASPSTSIVDDTASPPTLALEWMASDPVSATLDDNAFVQRFAVVTLYYSTNGSDWTSQPDPPWLSPVDECEWGGIVCGSDGVVLELNLDNFGVSGYLPLEIALLSQLILLSMFSGSLAGSLPTEIGQLTVLSSLTLSSQSLERTIPTEVGMLSQLRILNLNENSLTGVIPEEVSQLEGLESLKLDDNGLVGSLPLNQLPTSLTELDLSRNSFQGSIPASELGRLTKLTLLTLSRNSLGGGIPTELGVLFGLTSSVWIALN